MVIQIAEALDTTVNVLLGEETPEPKEQESAKALAARLEVLKEQFSKRGEKKRKIWRTVFVVNRNSCPGWFSEGNPFAGTTVSVQ